MIVDASVAIKWLVPEEGSQLANELLLQDELVAPDLVAAEISNAIWKKWGRGELAGVPPGLTDILRAFDSLEPIAPLAQRSAEIAIELDHPAYDCFYLALAEQRDEVLVTADERLLKKVSGTDFARRARSL
jgi:predicted nucleic acid-binding protein